MAVSDHTRKALAADGIPGEETTTLRNCINIQDWRKSLGEPVLREELELTEDIFLIGTVARIAQTHKDLPTFYKVAKALSEKYAHVRFAIVGEGHGDLLDQARRVVKEMSLETKLFFTGHRNDLLNIYRSFDVFLMTSYTEGMPNTVLEAMAMEVPVVSTAVAGVPELVADGETGILCPIGDVNKLVTAVSQLIEDPEKRDSFAESGRKRVETFFDFSWRVKTLEYFYQGYVFNTNGTIWGSPDHHRLGPD